MIEIPAQPARADQLPDLLKGFGAVPPLVTDINLSLDDRFLYVSCLGTGEFRQYDVSDPFNPVLTGNVRIGGIVNRTPHPKQPRQGVEWRTADGGSQPRRAARLSDELAVSHVGRTVLSGRHPRMDGQAGHAGRAAAWRSTQTSCSRPTALRPHQVRLQGGDASSDSYCFA